MPENQKNSEAASTAKVVYIVGPSRLQNDAIASCVERETAHKCILVENIQDISSRDLQSLEQPTLVLVDCQGKDPERILAEIRPYLKEKELGNHAVLFNVRPDQGIEKECVLAGIEGVFYEQDQLEIFLKGIEAVFAGELWLSRDIMAKCIREGAYRQQATESVIGILTLRQTEILALVAVGATNDEIADRLHLSPHTVKTHLYHIFKKIKVTNRLQAALWAAKNL